MWRTFRQLWQHVAAEGRAGTQDIRLMDGPDIQIHVRISGTDAQRIDRFLTVAVHEWVRSFMSASKER